MHVHVLYPTPPARAVKAEISLFTMLFLYSYLHTICVEVIIVNILTGKLSPFFFIIPQTS